MISFILRTEHFSGRPQARAAGGGFSQIAIRQISFSVLTTVAVTAEWKMELVHPIPEFPIRKAVPYIHQ